MPNHATDCSDSNSSGDGEPVLLPSTQLPCLTPTKPPIPIRLDDPNAFTEPDVVRWEKVQTPNGYIYELRDPTTTLPPLLLLQMRIDSSESRNFGIPKYTRKGTINDRKLFLVGGNPGDDKAWRVVVQNLRLLEELLEKRFPDVVEGVAKNATSFLKEGNVKVAESDEDDETAILKTTIKLQQPLSKEESHLYDLVHHPFYTYFLENADIPESHHHITLAVHSEPEDDAIPMSPDEMSPKPNKRAKKVKEYRNFEINPAAIYDPQGRLIHPRNYSTIKNKVVSAALTLRHVRNGKFVNNQEVPRAFIGLPMEVRMLDVDCDAEVETEGITRAEGDLQVVDQGNGASGSTAHANVVRTPTKGKGRAKLAERSGGSVRKSNTKSKTKSSGKAAIPANPESPTASMGAQKHSNQRTLVDFFGVAKGSSVAFLSVVKPPLVLNAGRSKRKREEESS
ncbi:hypothetical protein CVT24_012442 [Panaeolus cyanescens]|uniref:Uncharacterized protein n=1 Tax=Panaeolus cyanescens TaxID=181874 RepID=A0A409YJA3_9AGAR|nr:hypothetical protein CVT24_012442 [Panaeolus cyanescens]